MSVKVILLALVILSPIDFNIGLKNTIDIIAHGKSINKLENTYANAYTWEDINSEDSTMKYTHDTNYDLLIEKREIEDNLFKLEQLLQQTDDQVDKIISKLSARMNIQKNVFQPIKTETPHQSTLPYKKRGNDFIYPIVLLHGITSDKTEFASVEKWLGETVPNDVYNIEIGNGKFDSIFKPMNWQLDQLCAKIYSMPQLAGGFHFIGMSQGGLLARGYVERCNKYPVINLITWVTPHAGVFGINDIQFDFNKVYNSFYQNIYSFSGYWKDPFRYSKYLSSASYLPYLNNEINTTYRNNFYEGGDFNKGFYEDTYENIEWSQEQNKVNMLSLKNFVMIWSPNDDVITPPESGKFGFYDIISDNNKYSLMERLDILVDFVINDDELPVKDLFDSDQYRQDWLGLRTLFESNRLHIFDTNCTHSGHKTEACFPQLEEITLPFL